MKIVAEAFGLVKPFSLSISDGEDATSGNKLLQYIDKIADL